MGPNSLERDHLETDILRHCTWGVESKQKNLLIPENIVQRSSTALRTVNSTQISDPDTAALERCGIPWYCKIQVQNIKSTPDNLVIKWGMKGALLSTWRGLM